MTQLDVLEGTYSKKTPSVNIEVHNRYKAGDDDVCCHFNKNTLEYCEDNAEWVFETSYNGNDTKIAVCSIHCNLPSNE